VAQGRDQQLGTLRLLPGDVTAKTTGKPLAYQSNERKAQQAISKFRLFLLPQGVEVIGAPSAGCL
jgi:hypothetical protein